MFIRTLTIADLDPADTILMAAYNAHSFKAELQRYLALQPGGWFLVTSDEGPAAVGGTVHYGPYAYIGLIAVHPSMQRQGIGRVLMEHLLKWLETRKCPVVLLDASAAGVPLYTRLGFVEDDTTIVFQQAESSKHEFAGTRVSSLRMTDIPELVAFDTPIFGAERAAVFASYLTDYPERAFVTRDEAGQITGYLFAQQQSLGPWIARTAEDAEALLAHALSLPFTDAPRVVVPASNRDAPQLLEHYGFRQRRSMLHMRRGGTASPVYRKLIYGQASAAIG